MINMLVDPLPQSLIVNGIEYPIDTDFRASIRYELLPDDESQQAVLSKLQIYYGDNIPQDLLTAIDQVNWFRNCGKTPKKLTGAAAGNGKQAFSFECDSDYVYAAFLAQYRIDLTKIKYLHWWKFMALLESLDHESRIMEIMSFRVARLESLSREQKKYYQAMQNYFAIPKSEVEQEAIKELDEIIMNGGDPEEFLNKNGNNFQNPV